MNTLPKRIFGRPCGLLHQRLLKDLLAVDFFFKRPTSDEAVNYNSLLLPNAIHSVYKKTCFVILLAMFLGKSLANFGNKHAAFSYLYFMKSFGKLRFTLPTEVSNVKRKHIHNWDLKLNCSNIRSFVVLRVEPFGLLSCDLNTKERTSLVQLRDFWILNRKILQIRVKNGKASYLGKPSEQTDVLAFAYVSSG